MRIAVCSTEAYDQHSLSRANEQHAHGHGLTFFEPRLVEETASLAAGYPAVCAAAPTSTSTAVRLPCIGPRVERVPRRG